MTELIPGALFAQRYEIEALLGEGGFGVVYQAMDRVSAHRVAIKALKPEVCDLQTRQRFAREIAIVAQLRNEHTVRLLDSGTTPTGVAYGVFEVLGGRDLSAVLAEQRTLEPDVVRHILTQLLDALREAHARGLLHRDIKPENIRVLARDGDPWHVKLMDFGIARATDDGHPNLTATGEIVGTPRYMSPEQLTERELTPASDIYSLGVVAFEMLAGRDALQGARWSDQLERLQGEYVYDAAALLNAGDLRRIVQRMTSASPSARYKRADEVLRQLQRAGGPSPDNRSRANTRGRTLAIAIAVAAVLAIVFTILPRADPPIEPTQRAVNNVAPLLVHDEPDVRTVHRKPARNGARRSAGCGQPAPFNGAGQLGPGLDTWLTYLPHGYDPETTHPLVLLLHGKHVSPDVWLTAGGFKTLADRYGFVIIAPRSATDAIFGHAVERPWKSAGYPSRLADVFEETSARLCIDRARVFAVGQDIGGDMADRLHCTDWVTAAAVNSHRGAGRRRVRPKCLAKPFMMLSPMASKRLPVEGGAACANRTKVSLESEEDSWMSQLQCVGAPRDWGEPVENGTCVTWDCVSPFVSCRVDGGDPWPGTPSHNPACVGTTPEFPSGELVFEFFAAQEPLRTGCDQPAPFTGRGTLRSESDKWLTYVPKDYDPKVRYPVLMLLHQNMEKALTFLRASGFEALADQHGFIVVAPQHEYPPDPWKDPASERRLARIVPATAEKLCVNRDRVFVVGQSQGGHIAERLTCDGWVRGFTVSSHRNGAVTHYCDEIAVPMLMLTPTQSEHAPIEGGRSCTGAHKISLAEVEQAWRKRNGCRGSARDVLELGKSKCRTWSCETPFQSCTLDGGQGWPGTPKRAHDLVQKCDGTPPDFPSAEVVWEFFEGLDAPTSEAD